MINLVNLWEFGIILKIQGIEIEIKQGEMNGSDYDFYEQWEEVSWQCGNIGDFGWFLTVFDDFLWFFVFFEILGPLFWQYYKKVEKSDILMGTYMNICE